ncbi:DUF222 domain-containing protein [Nocardia sp. NPDC127526]|uniref:DUF222 domain-containing protein n=1 Tax=Nocardia sp. NPDC127526 TaxID=3345393 RepID=UPI00363CDA95
MADEELIDALRRAHGAAAFAQAAEITAVREVYRRHRAGNVEPGPNGVRAGEFAAAEIAVGAQVSEAVATAMIDIGLALDSLPQTRLAFAAGRIDLPRVQVIAESMRGLSKELRETLEPKLIETATRSDPARLRQTARRWVTRLDPEGEQRRREEREDDRDIRIRAVQDGMAVFDGQLPAAGAQTVAMRLREMSLQVCEDDPRTMQQRRADALVALADGSGRLRCGCGRGKYCPKSETPGTPRRPLIQVGVPAETLLGLRDDPAFLSGYGPIDAALARKLAEHARFQVIPEYFPADMKSPAAEAVEAERIAGEPEWITSESERTESESAQVASEPQRIASGSGRIVNETERIAGESKRTAAETEPAAHTSTAADAAQHRTAQTGKTTPGPDTVRPFSAAPPREIRAVDGLCRFPGCTMPAAETVVTHFDPLPAARTHPSIATRAVLCSHHYRLKVLADSGKQPWRVYLADSDRMRWIDPTGEPHETIREGARYLFPHTDIDAPAKPARHPLRSLTEPPEPVAPPRRFTGDIAYPLEDHVLLHPQLARSTPDNEIPESRTATR